MRSTKIPLPIIKIIPKAAVMSGNDPNIKNPIITANIIPVYAKGAIRLTGARDIPAIIIVWLRAVMHAISPTIPNW